MNSSLSANVLGVFGDRDFASQMSIYKFYK